MIYFREGDLVIRDMEEADAARFVDGELAQGWHPDINSYLSRLKDQRAGLCLALVAEVGGQTAGRINIYPNSLWGAFGSRGLPEIVDFAVLEKYQRRGVGTKLMDVAEELAVRYADTVYLGVGLHGGYGRAQRMYVRRGYLPDGSGAWYGDAVCEPYGACVNDDDLVLYLSKKLK